uniref:Uncharacterized protein n=1 Tax=Medicago truncatula TaxID=3880 RepID=I3SCS3_MEDTR|nr:unknown [Medicago truncatula]
MASSFTFSVVTVFLATVILTVHGCSPSDRTALLSFKASLKEPYHGIFNTWSGENCCVNWYGVSCDSTTGRVTDINLRGESEDPIISKSGKSGYMTGKISPEICKIDSLTSFILADWKAISGEIPQCLTSLSNLRILDLIGNQLTGKIPVNIGKLQRLTVLNLAENSISGEIPTSVVELCSLKHLDLSSNSLTGSIPVNFGNLQMLSRALLNRNQLTGSIPGFSYENLPPC